MVLSFVILRSLHVVPVAAQVLMWFPLLEVQL